MTRLVCVQQAQGCTPQREQDGVHAGTEREGGTVWKRNVYELVETPGPHDRRVEDIWAIGRANNEDGLPRTNTINLG